MQLLAQQRARVSVSDEPNALHLNAVYDLRRNNFVAALLLSALFVWQLWTWLQHRQSKGLLFLAVLLLMLLRFTLGSNQYSASLTVTEFELRVEYAIGSGRVTDRLLAEHVQELEFNYGTRALHGQHYDFGMYAEVGRFQSQCVFPLIDESQVAELTALILEKYPHYSKGSRDLGGFTTLGLSTL